MDYDSVIEDFCGDVAALKDSLRAFQSSSDLETLRKNVEKMDIEGIRTVSHRIRKSAEKLGLGELKTAASRLEEVNAEKIPADAEHLETLYTDVLMAMAEEKL